MLVPLGDQIIIQESRLDSLIITPSTAKAPFRATVLAKSTGITEIGRIILDKFTIGSVLLVAQTGKRFALPSRDVDGKTDCFICDIADVIGLYEPEKEDPDIDDSAPF